MLMQVLWQKWLEKGGNVMRREIGDKEVFGPGEDQGVDAENKEGFVGGDLLSGVQNIRLIFKGMPFNWYIMCWSFSFN